MNDIKRLKPGDPCPICGQPIRTEDPKALLVMSVMAELVELSIEMAEGQSIEKAPPDGAAPAGLQCSELGGWTFICEN